MDLTHYIKAEVIGEFGYKQALMGLALNKNKNVEDMPEVARRLAPMDGGHNKFLEHIKVWTMVTAPRYWWQEADTYRHASKNSQSTMHTILKGYLIVGDFENEDISLSVLDDLNELIKRGDLVLLKKRLPEGFLQKRMWTFNYKTLRNIILQRKGHRLPHWVNFLRQVRAGLRNPELLPFPAEWI